MKRILAAAVLSAFLMTPALHNTAQAARRAKVRVCHVSPDAVEGSPAKQRVIEISESALSAHLAHGDFETFASVGTDCAVPE
jgi:hypothetical protein